MYFFVSHGTSGGFEWRLLSDKNDLLSHSLNYVHRADHVVDQIGLLRRELNLPDNVPIFYGDVYSAKSIGKIIGGKAEAKRAARETKERLRATQKAQSARWRRERWQFRWFLAKLFAIGALIAYVATKFF